MKPYLNLYSDDVSKKMAEVRAESGEIAASIQFIIAYITYVALTAPKSSSVGGD